MLHIVVCLKAIPDPDVPAADLKIDGAAKRASGGSYVINPFDENALELALKLKEAAGDVRITAVSAGGPEAADRLRKALAVGADAAVRLEPPTEPDAFAVAAALAGAVRRLGDVSLVLAGRQAGDWDHGQAGGLLAELLGWAHVPFAFAAAPAAGGLLQLTRETAAGQATVEAPLPLVVTATNHADCVLRLPKTKEILQARRATIAEYPAEAVQPRTRVRALRPAAETGRRCEMLGGADPVAQAEALVAWLKERGLLAGGAER